VRRANLASGYSHGLSALQVESAVNNRQARPNSESIRLVRADILMSSPVEIARSSASCVAKRQSDEACSTISRAVSSVGRDCLSGLCNVSID